MRLAAAIATVVIPAAVPAGAATLALANEEELAVTAEDDGLPIHERHAPILRLSSGEAFLPVRRDEYVTKTNLIAVYNRKLRGDWRVPLDDTPAIGALPTKPVACDQRFRTCHFALKVDGAQPATGKQPYMATQDRILSRSRLTVYWHREMDDRTIQYWFLYVFNDWANRHESDWEQITIQLDERDLPERLGYSSHEGGQSMMWQEAVAEGLIEAEHPVVLVALGSHANYFRTDTRFPEECTARVPRRFCAERTDALGRKILPGDYDLLPLTPPVFHGDYSSGNFIGQGRAWKRISRGIVVGDPQSRTTVWTNPKKWLKHTHPADGQRRERQIGE